MGGDKDIPNKESCPAQKEDFTGTIIPTTQP